MDKKYEVLEHPADLKIVSYGKSLGDVFSNMLEGMFKSCRPKLTSEEVVRKITLSSEDKESLLINFLSEALSLSDINDEVYFGAKFNKLTEKYLEGEIKGFKVKSLGLEIKAATWHDLKLEKKKDLIEATVLFDI